MLLVIPLVELLDEWSSSQLFQLLLSCFMSYDDQGLMSVFSTSVMLLMCLILIKSSTPYFCELYYYTRGIDACYSFSQGIYLFGFGIQLFDVSNNGSQWALWVIHKLLLTGVYGLIFFMYRSRWRERLPGEFHLMNLCWVFYELILLYPYDWYLSLITARPAFQNYISIMFCINATALLACALAAHGTGLGLWYAVFSEFRW